MNIRTTQKTKTFVATRISRLTKPAAIASPPAVVGIIEDGIIVVGIIVVPEAFGLSICVQRPSVATWQAVHS